MGILLKCIKIKLFLTSVLEKPLINTPKRIAFGFSLSSLPLLERLKASNHVDQIFISDRSGFLFEEKASGLIQSMPKAFLKDHWQKKNQLIFIGSIGAVVRLISPFVSSKENDPAILVMDSKAKNIIPLLGGHKQGGDRFANELSAALEAEAIFTSDSFIERKISLDCFGKAWGLSLIHI